MALFLARNARGEAVGRIAAIVNGEHLRHHQDDTGFFGFFESDSNPKTSHALFESAANWLTQHGLRRMRGPANPTFNDVSGCLVEGFDRDPAVMMPYGLSRYPAMFSDSGFQEVASMSSFYLRWKDIDRTRLNLARRVLEQRHPSITILPASRKRGREFRAFVDALYRLYAPCFSDIWGFVPPTRAEFDYLAKEMQTIIDPSLVLLAQHESTPIGFALSLPDIHPLLKLLPRGRMLSWQLPRFLLRAYGGRIRQARTMLIGVLPSYRRRGIEAALIDNTIEAIRRHGYIGSELGWVMSNNHILVNMLERLGAKRTKRYAIFERAI
jgi:GNAT superfamily N-acetyltransferase